MLKQTDPGLPSQGVRLEQSVQKVFKRQSQAPKSFTFAQETHTRPPKCSLRPAKRCDLGSLSGRSTHFPTYDGINNDSYAKPRHRVGWKSC